MTDQDPRDPAPPAGASPPPSAPPSIPAGARRAKEEMDRQRRAIQRRFRETAAEEARRADENESSRSSTSLPRIVPVDEQPEEREAPVDPSAETSMSLVPERPVPRRLIVPPRAPRPDVVDLIDPLMADDGTLDFDDGSSDFGRPERSAAAAGGTAAIVGGGAALGGDELDAISEAARDRRRTRDRRSRFGAVAVSAVLHVGVIAVLALLTWGAVQSPAPEPTVGMSDTPVPPGPMGPAGGSAAAADASADTATTAAPAAAVTAPVPAPPAPSLEAVASPALSSPAVRVADAMSALAGELAAETAAPTPGAGAGGAKGQLAGTSAGFQQLAGSMGQAGLDVVLVLDATESMGPTIGAARSRLMDLIDVLSGVLDSEDADDERLRIGIVAFKDYGDEYGLDAIDGTPLTSDVNTVRTFLDSVVASGGGDVPEPVNVGLAAAADRRMGWERGRRKVVVLIGDAPVHAGGRDDALRIAAAFKRQGDGTMSVLDTGQRRGSVLPDFAAIANAGGGSAIQLTDVDGFWRSLIVGIFGSEYAADVDTIVERYVGRADD